MPGCSSALAVRCMGSSVVIWPMYAPEVAIAYSVCPWPKRSMVGDLKLR